MNSIVLIGAPGSGKSTVGKILADTTGLSLIDTDELVESKVGDSVAGIFLNNGEAYFRELERECVHLALLSTKHNPAIISLGGGSVLNPDTQRELGGIQVAWLKVNISQALKRVGMNQSRPLLLGNVRANMINLLKERTPIYENLATFTIDVSDISPQQCSTEILAFMKTFGDIHDSPH